MKLPATNVVSNISFSKKNFCSLCDELAVKEKAFQNIIDEFGYPPLWARPATFSTLIHIILEQQVSLASAYAAFKKLKQKIGFITPSKILLLTDVELKACYFSRQKTIYARALGNAIASKQIVLKKFADLEDADVRRQLKAIKGIGDWTVDVYLLFALQRTDVFPLGDLAMVNALKEVNQLPGETKQEELLKPSMRKLWAWPALLHCCTG